MKIRPLKLICLIPTFIWGTLLHAGAQQGPPQGPPPSPVVEALDKNKDRQLSSREIRHAAKALLKLDKNKDGALSEEELKPKPKRERQRRGSDDEERPKPPKSPLITALDTDQSGDLSKSEIQNAPEALIKLDRDEDGELSSDEAGIRGPQGGDGGQGGGGQGGGGRPGPPPRR